MTTYTYSPEEISLIWTAEDKDGNIDPFTLDLTDGLAEGTFITVSTDEDRFSKQVGANGKVVRTRNANRSGTIELTLMQQSLAHLQLFYAAAQDDAADNQRIGNFYIVSAEGELPLNLFTLEDCWIKKLPDTTGSKENGERTWMFDVAKVLPDLDAAQTAINLARGLQ